MHPFTVSDLQELLGTRKGPCVSIFLPTHRRSDGAREDRVRFGNLVDEARSKLEAVVAPRAVPKLLAPIEAFTDPDFWHASLDGLAVFSAPGFTRYWRLAADLPERVVVSDSFHVRPLIGYLQSGLRWYVLCLSGNTASFFEATPSGLVAKQVPGMPRTPADADIARQEKPGLSSHSAGGGRAVFHGGSESRSAHEDVARWFRAIDQSVCRLLRDEHAPLVIAGVSKLQSTFRAVSRYPHLLAAGVDGNFGRAKPDELFARAAPIAAAALVAREDEAVAEFQRVNGAMHSSDDLDVVGAAAVAGRVRRLLVARGRTVRGVFDRGTGAVKKRAGRDNAFGDEVIDDIAEAVLLRGGSVLVVDRDRMPSKSPVAAVLRW